MKHFHVAALTGRSGTGKSYASAYLSKHGVAIIDGDVVARKVVEPGSRCLKALVREFSPDILYKDGSLDRRKLADIAFSDRRKKERLDAIIHPYIIERLLDDFDDMKKNGVPYCVVEAGALIESGLYAICDKIIMITADEEISIARIVERDGITQQQAQTRLSAQMKEEEVRDLCDIIITNNGTLEEFEEKLDVLAQQLDSWFLKK